MRRLVAIDAAQSVLIDALQGETFAVSMGTSIKHLRVKNASPGQLYVFLLTQDQRGGHTVTWGSDIRNGAVLNPHPNSITVQSFIADTGGILEANIPGTN